ncbi:MAG: PAS domain-containing protein [Thermodesulfobacteriota bacterium]
MTAELYSLRERLEFMVAAIPAIIYICEPYFPYRFTYMSGTIREQLGYEPEEFLADPNFWADHIHPDDAPRVFSELAQLFEKGRLAHEYRFRHQDGSYRWMHTEFRLVRESEGRPLELVGYCTDVTARKQTEERLAALTRLYAVRSRINAAIVRLRDPQELYEEVARVAVEEGRFRLAWIGAVDEEAQRLRPVVQAGKVEGYLDEIDVFTLPAPETRNPTAIAVREGRVQVCNDLQRDPRGARWQEEALRRGYRASGAFPLRCNSRVVAVLSLYADTPGFFDDQEVQLLTALSEDLSFALTAMAEQEKRRDAELAVQKSADRFRALAKAGGLIAWITDAAGRVTEFSPSWQALTGQTPEDARGRGWQEALHPDDRILTKQAWSRAVANMEPFATEYRLRGQDGAYRFFLAHGVPVMAPEGGIREWVGVCMDITERKRAEEALKEREATLAGVLRTAPIGIGLVYNRALAWANDHLANFTGYSIDDLKGRDSRRLYKSDAEYERVGRVYQTLNATGVASVETCWQRRDGKSIDIWLSLSPLDPADLAGGVVVAAMDITDRKRAEEKLEQRTEELAALNALAHRVQASLSLEEVTAAALDRSVYPTPPDLAMLYLREDDRLVLQGARPELLALSQNEARLRIGECLCGLALKEGKPVYAPDIHADPRCTLTACKEGGMRSFAALPLWGGERILGVLGLAWAAAQDVEAQANFLETIVGEIAMGLYNALLYRELQQHARELDRRVRERTEQLQAANKELEAFAYSISHDLRAPLRAVSGFAQIIARRHRGALNEEGQHYVDNIVLASERMGCLIDDLLAYSRLGRYALKLRALDLGKVLNQAIDNLADRVAATGAIINLPGDWPLVFGDQTLLQQIFTNLLDNALTYHQPGVVPELRVTWTLENGQIILAVADNGIGIPPEYQEKIFNVFQRLHSDEDYPGTGIGLAIVKKATEMLGGRIWVESAVGQGSTFLVKLPKG